jgi:nucleoside-diphosphate-sugar epimerase
MTVNTDRKPAAGRLPLPCAMAEVDDWLGEPPEGVISCLARHRGPFLVLGAGGKLGLHLCVMLKRALGSVGRDEAVIAVSRFTTLRDREDFSRRGIVVVPGDLTDATFLSALPAAPTIFFLAGVKFGTAAQPELLETINVKLPRAIAERYRRSRVIAFSSGCVYPFVPPESGGATEATAPAPHGAYALSCLQRERAFQAISAQWGTPVTLIRLNYSVEFRYGVLLDIAQDIWRGEPVGLEAGYVNVIWQRDALAHVIQALDLAGSPAVPLNVAGSPILSVREIALRLGELLGVPVRFRGTEAPTAWLSNASRARREFGDPPTSLESMLTWVTAWLQCGGEVWGKPTGFERRDGNF